MNIINNEGQHSVHPNIGGFIFNDDDNATLDNAAMDDEDGINNTPIDASLDHEMHESSEEDFITASEDSMEDIMQTEMDFDIANEDPYMDYGLFRRNVIPFDRNLNIQEGILNRIESDIEWARIKDDSMGYNQTFDPPPNGFPSNFHYPPSNNYHMGISNSRDDQSNDEDDQNLIITIDDTSSSSSPSPEVPSDHLANSDSLPAWSGEIMHQITDGSPSEVNTVLELNFGNSRHLPYSDTSHLSAATDFHPPISLASESIKLKGIELQAASTSISMMIANGSKEDILSGPESGLLNKVTDKYEVEILRGCSEGMMGLADWQSVTGERAEYGDLARAIRKRKSSSVPGYSPILEESLISIGYAKSYLTHLAKRNCCMKDQDIRDFYTKNAANNAANTADSHAAFKMKANWKRRWEDFDEKLEETMNIAIDEGKEEPYDKINEELKDFSRMEALSVTPEVASEDKDLKSLLDAFGSKFSLEDIASAFCKAGRDPALAGQILSGTQQSPSTHKMHASNVPLTNRTHSRASKVNGFSETHHANGRGLKATISKRNPASMGTVSGVLGNYYVWRAAKSNGNPNETKPLKVDASDFSMPVSYTDHSLESKDANLRTFEDSSLKKDSDMNDDVENFLFEMLGRGFQLERSAIHEVLGQCGYDMKKSLETLLDLAAETLDKQYDVHKSNNLHSDSRTFSSRNQQKVAESNRLGNNAVNLMQPSGIYEQQQEVLTSLFHAPERSGSTVSASIKKSARSSRAPEGMLAELPEDISYEHTAIPTRPRFAKVIVEADDDPYQILRKAVKEHRDTMKEYYRAATEAFASGDRAKATLLLEKGQFFYNKAREADEESASKIFETSGNDEVQDDMSLDLQDHQAREAIQLVKCHLRTLSGISCESSHLLQMFVLISRCLLQYHL
ncbi:hypothetical protein KSS87_002043 [Heliosperma pusillum]|nr:hypothetical protein KSS87_002043 [Heliosperma pusillum]